MTPLPHPLNSKAGPAVNIIEVLTEGLYTSLFITEAKVRSRRFRSSFDEMHSCHQGCQHFPPRSTSSLDSPPLPPASSHTQWQSISSEQLTCCEALTSGRFHDSLPPPTARDADINLCWECACAQKRRSPAFVQLTVLLIHNLEDLISARVLLSSSSSSRNKTKL